MITFSDLIMNISKSSRHSKIAGDFGEALFLYWLSKSGYEIALVDHTGIDLVAYDKKTEKRYGISVKTRTRSTPGTENEGFYVKPDNIDKVKEACIHFACEPYFGIVVDRPPKLDAFLVSLDDIIEINGIGKIHINIKVNEKYLRQYMKLKNTLTIRMEYDELSTFESEQGHSL